MYENDMVLRDAIVPMKSKYLKYQREIPYLYAFAFLLDPRGKLDAFGSVLELLSEATGLDYTDYFAQVRSQLYEVYQRYENKFRGIRSQRPPVAPALSRLRCRRRRSGPGGRATEDLAPHICLAT